MNVFSMAFQGALIVIICHSLVFSIAEKSPGLDFRPLPSVEQGNLIWYNSSKYESYKRWTNSLDDFLAVYTQSDLTPGRGQNIYNCDYNQPPPKGKVCHVDIRSLGPCNRENNYSYHKSSPCIFLKLKNINGWVPVYHNTSRGLPEVMPLSLKSYISDLEKDQVHKMNTIWVSCEGEAPADKEIIGPIDYYPAPGFPGYYYPYQNSEGYLSPLVAVHFRRPMSGIIINVECKSWARNIAPDREENIGIAHIELLID